MSFDNDAAAVTLPEKASSYSILMQDDTPSDVPMAVRMAISNWMPYFKSSFLFFIVVKV